MRSSASGSETARSLGKEDEAFEMAIPMKEGDEEVPATESQYEERFWRRRLDGIALDTVNKRCYLIEFKRTRDRRHSYEARAMEVACKQYESLMGGLRAIGEQRGWEIGCLLYTSPSPRDRQKSRMPSSA